MKFRKQSFIFGIFNNEKTVCVFNTVDNITVQQAEIIACILCKFTPAIANNHNYTMQEKDYFAYDYAEKNTGN